MRRGDHLAELYSPQLIAAQDGRCPASQSVADADHVEDVDAAVAVGVALLRDGLAVKSEADLRVELAVIVGVLLGARRLPLLVVDEFVVAAVSVGVGALLLELLLLVEEQDDRLLARPGLAGLRSGRARFGERKWFCPNQGRR